MKKIHIPSQQELKEIHIKDTKLSDIILAVHKTSEIKGVLVNEKGGLMNKWVLFHDSNKSTSTGGYFPTAKALMEHFSKSYDFFVF